MPAPLSKWLPQVLPQLQDCPAIVAERAILMAAIQFCQQTNVVRWDDYFTASDATHSYPLDTPAGTAVQRIERVAFDGQALPPLPIEDAELDFPTWRNVVAPGRPQGFTQSEPGSIVLLPCQAGRVDFTVSLAPTPTANSLPDVLASKFFYGIAAGAVAQLKSMVGTSWYDPDGIAWQQSQFAQAIADGLHLVNHGQHRVKRRTRASFL